MRLFIALDISEEVRARVAEAVTLERATVDARWVKTEGLHLTLVFFGELHPGKVTEIIATATRVAASAPKLELGIEGAGTFAGRQPRVLWLGVTGTIAPLAALAQQLSEELKVVSQHPDYTPHLTIARSMTQRGDPMLNDVAKRLESRQFGEWKAEHLTLYESAGGRYRPLAAFPLGVEPPARMA